MSSDLGMAEGAALGDFVAFPLASEMGSNTLSSSTSDSKELIRETCMYNVGCEGNDYLIYIAWGGSLLC